MYSRRYFWDLLPPGILSQPVRIQNVYVLHQSKNFKFHIDLRVERLCPPLWFAVVFKKEEKHQRLFSSCPGPSVRRPQSSASLVCRWRERGGLVSGPPGEGTPTGNSCPPAGGDGGPAGSWAGVPREPRPLVPWRRGWAAADPGVGSVKTVVVSPPKLKAGKVEDLHVDNTFSLCIRDNTSFSGKVLFFVNSTPGRILWSGCCTWCFK